MKVHRNLWRVAALFLAAVTALLAGAVSWHAERAAAPIGQWKERSQLVWDGGQRTMVRRSFTVWDPHPELDLDFFWEGEDRRANRSGVINGDGRLRWLAKGAPSYDPQAVFSVYEGRMRDGRPDGRGRLKKSSGQVFEGEWRDGRMAGQGVMRFANGDKYSGTFTDGRPDGIGGYMAVNGTAFEGGFSNGVRDGPGVLTLPDTRAFRSIWRNGEEIDRSPLDGKPVEVAQAGGLVANVYIDEKLNADFKNADPENNSYAYTATRTAEGVRIWLDSPEILRLWKGDATIDALSRFNFEAPSQFAPLFLVIELTNEGGRTVQINGGYMELDSSKTDLQPYVVMSGPLVPGDFDPDFTLYNYGWGAVEDARLTYAFGDESGPATQTVSLDIGSFENSVNSSVLSGLQQLGADVQRLQNRTFECQSDNRNACVARWVSDVLGDVSGAAFYGFSGNLSDISSVFTRVWGTLEYTWTDISGVSNRRASTVSFDIPLLEVLGMAEMGAPAPIERGFPTIRLPLDQANRRIPLNYTEQLAPGGAKRFALNFVADKSSSHRFRFAFELEDGSTVTTSTVDFLYFIPRVPAYN